jgi:predicted DNA-binding ribbon-helix-helix protein
MLRVKTETYKQLKPIALDFDIPLTKLIDKLLEEHQKQNVNSAIVLQVARD